ncbi:hypothetical protein Cni_G20125 [Canna indica]|uniref:EF-hand domain-containing protein n=1 Tax=Canna indica TaxID=4628 RepID=A0AAQ3KQS1_9LILI|nr:hypothetical protein Cni_G20125 [Canna indica]
MEKLLPLHEPLQFLFLYSVLYFIYMPIKRFSLNSLSFLHAHVGFCTCLSMTHDQEQQPPVKSSNGASDLQREELEMILSRIGLCSRSEDKQVKEKMNLEEIPDLFADEEPSLEEVKEAFSVFDENGDGFIDELELQTVLGNLGIAEGLDLDACRRMIQVYDRNRDGKVDFYEFVKFMEISLC